MMITNKAAGAVGTAGTAGASSPVDSSGTASRVGPAGAVRPAGPAGSAGAACPVGTAGTAEPLGLYIHIPFCLQKCGYCDFYSEAGQSEEVQQAYIATLVKEIGHYGRMLGGRRVDTVFIGGGTPSILRPQLLADVLAAARQWFFVEPGAEITMECNPATLTEEKLEVYRKIGVNRLSMGVQSMDDGLLKIMGRVHDRQAVFDSYQMMEDAGFTNINLDIMFGVPGQTIEMCQDTVRQVLDLEPAHLSFYSLELAEGTEFYRRLSQGKLQETAPELDRQMYHWLLEELKRQGYEQYEISNGARPGYRCRHNLKYWNLEEYLGLGAAAHSYVNHTRWANRADIGGYISAMEAGATGAEGVEVAEGSAVRGIQTAGAAGQVYENTWADDVTDFTFTALRKCEGIDLVDFEKRFGAAFWDVFGDRKTSFEAFAEGGDAALDGNILRITEKGMDIANQIIALFVGVDGERGEDADNG